jgi:hypothetical protein
MEGRGGAGGEELPGHHAHEQVYDKVFFMPPEVPEDKVEDQCLEERAEQRPEKAEGGILIAVFQVNYSQVPD